MFRQGSPLSYGMMNSDSPKASGEGVRRAKKLPSNNGIPKCWNEAMDRTICYLETQDEVSSLGMVRFVKRRFPELNSVSGKLFSLIESLWHGWQSLKYSR